MGGDDGEVRILREGPELDPALKIVVHDNVELEGSDQPAERMSCSASTGWSRAGWSSGRVCAFHAPSSR